MAAKISSKIRTQAEYLCYLKRFYQQFAVDNYSGVEMVSVKLIGFTLIGLLRAS